MVKADERTKKQIDLVKRQAGSGTDFRNKTEKFKTVEAGPGRRACFLKLEDSYVFLHTCDASSDMRVRWGQVLACWQLCVMEVTEFLQVFKASLAMVLRTF